ncbi:MAG: cytochrome c biogenesis heme-transporting ATPase CcmA [Shewanella sp.]|nr:cytochrome c biogenesis heme-transporting ATPase CcmA [Shewanella sp.]
MTQTTSVIPLLSADKLTCIREERILFDELSFGINSGDIVQIEGPNGAGKTSLLRILTGLSRPYEGQVLFHGTSITQCNEEYHQDLLYLGHKASVKPELTAEENLHVSLTLSGHTNFDTRDILSNVNLTGFEDALAGHLSAGQHRRTSLARLWHTHAKIWILDEPFTAIDKKGVEQLEQLFLTHVARGGCVIFTSHQDLGVISSQQLRRILLSSTDE